MGLWFLENKYTAIIVVIFFFLSIILGKKQKPAFFYSKIKILNIEMTL